MLTLHDCSILVTQVWSGCETLIENEHLMQSIEYLVPLACMLVNTKLECGCKIGSKGLMVLNEDSMAMFAFKAWRNFMNLPSTGTAASASKVH